jgi:hypothetical protein
MSATGGAEATRRPNMRWGREALAPFPRLGCFFERTQMQDLDMRLGAPQLLL